MEKAIVKGGKWKTRKMWNTQSLSTMQVAHSHVTDCAPVNPKIYQL